MPEGQIHFANIREVLEDFLANVARLGLEMFRNAHSARLMCNSHITETETGSLFRVCTNSRISKSLLLSTMRAPTGGELI
jgi:hypothetical protein